MESNTGQVFNLISLYDRFQGLHDKRKAKGKRYTLVTILMGIFLAKLCGEDKPAGTSSVTNAAKISPRVVLISSPTITSSGSSACAARAPVIVL